MHFQNRLAYFTTVNSLLLAFISLEGVANGPYKLFQTCSIVVGIALCNNFLNP